MRVIKTETFRAEIQRIRYGVSRVFGEGPELPESPREPLLSPRLTIRDVMQTGLKTVRPHTPLAPAVRLMIDSEVSSLPVVNSDGAVVGALNQKDLLKVFYDPTAMTVGSVMTRDPIVMSIDAPLVDVIDRLMSTDFRRAHIQEGGRLVGVIVRTHLMPTVLHAIEDMAAVRAMAREIPH